MLLLIKEYSMSNIVGLDDFVNSLRNIIFCSKFTFYESVHLYSHLYSHCQYYTSIVQPKP